MKTIKHKLILFLILTLPILFLTSCFELSDADWELVEVAFESWAEENGLLENDQWQPEGVVKTTIEKTIGDLNNEKESVELDGLDVIRNIEEADKLASEGLQEWDNDKMHKAETLRPNDWRIQEQSAILKFNAGMPIVSYDFSDQFVAEQIQRGGNCAYLRRQQLEYREALLEDNIANCSKQNFCSPQDMKTKLTQTQNEIIYIHDKGNSIFCDQLKDE